MMRTTRILAAALAGLAFVGVCLFPPWLVTWQWAGEKGQQFTLRYRGVWRSPADLLYDAAEPAHRRRKQEHRQAMERHNVKLELWRRDVETKAMPFADQFVRGLTPEQIAAAVGTDFPREPKAPRAPAPPNLVRARIDWGRLSLTAGPALILFAVVILAGRKRAV